MVDDEDICPESVPANDAGEPSGTTELETLRSENAELRDRLLRALAETENVRRRAERDRPKMAFLFDIRRQALLQHQMFKAMFELAPDRADFISMLFSKPRPSTCLPLRPKTLSLPRPFRWLNPAPVTAWVLPSRTVPL